MLSPTPSTWSSLLTPPLLACPNLSSQPHAIFESTTEHVRFRLHVIQGRKRRLYTSGNTEKYTRVRAEDTVRKSGGVQQHQARPTFPCRCASGEGIKRSGRFEDKTGRRAEPVAKTEGTLSLYKQSVPLEPGDQQMAQTHGGRDPNTFKDPHSTQGLQGLTDSPTREETTTGSTRS